MIYLNKLLPLIVSPLVLTLLLVTIGTLTRRRWITFSGAPSEQVRQSQRHSRQHS